MSETRFLPVHDGMPVPMSTTAPAVLTSVPTVEKFLTGTPFAGQSVNELTGGYSNYVYRVHLIIPFHDQETVILKHAQAVSKSWATPDDMARLVSRPDCKQKTIEFELSLQKIRDLKPKR
jgi:hypothetical protein